MTSPGQHGGVQTPNPTMLAKPNALEEGHAIDEAMALLDDLGELAVAEHVERFEAVHTALTEALSRAENLLSGSSGNGS